MTSPGRIVAGRNVKIEEGVELQGLARRGIVLGDGVTLGRLCAIRPSSYYGVDLGEGLCIGAGSAIGAGSWIGASGFVEIGRDVLLGPQVVIIPENHVFEDTSRTIKEQGVQRAGVTIEDDCWIGTRATILSGVRIGRGSIVAAGAVVRHDVPPGAIVGGVPARVLRMRTESARRSA
ncbi:MAG: acyltransferase [Planctomycetes bacterium]|nr:acyltransferase [Planctomycetota bacterium]